MAKVAIGSASLVGMSKYESTSYLCTLFDIQCCQSVIRKLVYGFMCRLDSYVNYIIHGIGAIQVLRNADAGLDTNF